MHELIGVVAAVLRRTAQSLWRLVKAYPAHLLVTLCLVFLLAWAWNSYQGQSIRKITLFVGPIGSSSHAMSKELAEAIEGSSRGLGGRYRVDVVTTQGHKEIEDRISNDTSGSCLGMTIDGQQKTEDLRVLLPMGWDYLHVLASAELLQRLNLGDVISDEGKKRPLELADIIDSVAPGRVFAGPPDSGTRAFAKSLFYKHKKDLDVYAAVALKDWDDAVNALRLKQIDLAFYCGPLGADTVNYIGRDETAVLIGVEKSCNGIVIGQNNGAQKGVIPSNYYSAYAFKSDQQYVRAYIVDEMKSPNVVLHFNSVDVPTIISRRLVVASKNMSDHNAYILAGAIKEHFTNKRIVSFDTWKRIDSLQPPSGFSLPVHPGAEIQRRGDKFYVWWDPNTWSSTAFAILVATVTASLTLILQNINGILSLKSRPALSDYLKLKHELDELLRGFCAPNASCVDAERRLSEVWSKVQACRNEGKLTPKQFSILRKGWREVKAEIGFATPVNSTTSPSG